MPNTRLHFAALLHSIEPPDERAELAAEQAGLVRDWLTEHDFPTVTPHTRLVGSYGRRTAIDLIPDIDVITLIDAAHLGRTPNAVLLELHRALKEYPAGEIDTRGQRRSVRLSLPALGVHLDLVPAVADDGLEKALRVPDRPLAEWILSDPLGYAARLTRLNQDHGSKVIPLIKLFKAWRDEAMPTRCPKSYVLEVIIVQAIESEDLVLAGGYGECVRAAFRAIDRRFRDLFENGKEAPRIRDPQVPANLITKGWARTHFETFMRRVGEAAAASEAAEAAATQESALDAWRRVFGSRWPTIEQVEVQARLEAAGHQPGLAGVGSSGLVIGATGRTVPSIATRFHGGR